MGECGALCYECADRGKRQGDFNARLRRRPDAFEITLGCVLYALGVKNSGATDEQYVRAKVRPWSLVAPS